MPFCLLMLVLKQVAVRSNSVDVYLGKGLSRYSVCFRESRSRASPGSGHLQDFKGGSSSKNK